MIDRAGLKGTRYGEAEVSTMHANFIVAHDGATASDVLHLIDLVRERVRDEFDTELATEIEIWKPQGSGIANRAATARERADRAIG
jgi:UDP-N-acetylmuramate dehydrogenase